MRTAWINSSFGASFSATQFTLECPDATPLMKTLYSPHQLSNRCPQRVSNCLNRKKARVFNTSFYPAQKSPVNVGFGGKRFLRQLFLRSEFSNSLTKSFGNVMTHLRQVCPFTMANGCRLYTITPVDSGPSQCHNNPHWIFKQDVARQAHERRQSSEVPASARQKQPSNFMAPEDYLKDLDNLISLLKFQSLKQLKKTPNENCPLE